MALLKAHNSFLKRNGKIIVNRGGGLKLWELDIPNLQLSNHTMQNGMKCSFNNTSSFSKVDGKLVCGTSNFDFEILNLNVLGNIKKIEIIIDEITIGRYCYVGACKSYVRKSYDISNFGTWNAYRYPSGERWNFLKGYYFGDTLYGNWYFIGYQGINLILPLKIEVVFEEGKVKQYFNGELVAEKNDDYASLPANENWYNFNVNSGGSYGTKCVISCLKVFYE